MYKKQDDLFAHLIDKPLYKYHSMERLFLKFCIRIQNLKVHWLNLKKYPEHAG